MNAEPKELEEWLRLAYSSGKQCPPPESFLTGVDTTLSSEDRSRLAEHLARCPACAAEQDLARAFDAPAEPDEQREDVRFVVARLEASSPFGSQESRRSGPRAARRSWTAAPWRLAAAAVIVAGLGGAALMLRPTAPTLPRPAGHTTTRGSVITIDGPIGELPEFPKSLRWSELPEANRYRVRLSGVDETTIWEATVSASPAVFPDDVTDRLHRAVVYHWQVEALDASGSRIAWSEQASFRVAPEPERSSD